MNQNIKILIDTFESTEISEERRSVLMPWINNIIELKQSNRPVNLNFICTHNSRRSHLSQIWAQTMAHYFNISQVFCYSGGTEATAMFPKVSETLGNQGFEILRLSDGANPVYAIKFDENAPAVICFSKKYDQAFNPKSDFCAIITCTSADIGCPSGFGTKNHWTTNIS